MPPKTIVFVHGWSVTHTNTYGELPERLAAEAAAAGEDVVIKDLWLSRYVSFHDEVRMPDLAWAMECAVRRDLAAMIAANERFAVITHSTGGPVARAWWYEFYSLTGKSCPMSHLVMLAPANFGSALAQLGKSRLSRLQSWWNDVEPGQGILDWLEHGSGGAWDLNEAWIRRKFGPLDETGVFPFVLTGQSIDRSLYDHLNAYTGELGSDGVVRVASANLNSAMVRLEQKGVATKNGIPLVPAGKVLHSPICAFRLISGVSHSGEDMGIMRSVEKKVGGDGKEVVDSIRRCLKVADSDDYGTLCTEFDADTDAVQQKEYVEIEEIKILPDRAYIHDPMALAIVRITDSEGFPVQDLDLVLTGAQDSPDLLPEGFLADRQRNQRQKNMLTFFMNHDVMIGCDEVPDPRKPDRILREAQEGLTSLGVHVTPRPEDGFVHYVLGAFAANPKLLKDVVRPHETTLIDIVLQRVVHEGAFRLGPASNKRVDFSKTDPGDSLPPRS